MSAACTLYEIEDELVYLLDTLEGLLPEEEETRLELEEAITRAVRSEIKKVDGISHMLAHFESQANSPRQKASDCRLAGRHTNDRGKGLRIMCAGRWI